MYIRLIKPVLDIAVGILGTIILLPFLSVIAIIIFLMTGDNPLFIQKRVGLHGKLFSVVKFKTMDDKTDEKGNLLPDNERETKIGKMLRSASIDELPQVINILKGEMSLVGPRPWIPEQMENFSDLSLDQRSKVKPGITGLAQIRGRNEIPFEQRMSYDLYYVRHCSFLKDICIIRKTVVKVLKMEGVRQASRDCNQQSLI